MTGANDKTVLPGVLASNASDIFFVFMVHGFFSNINDASHTCIDCYTAIVRRHKMIEDYAFVYYCHEIISP